MCTLCQKYVFATHKRYLLWHLQTCRAMHSTGRGEALLTCGDVEANPGPTPPPFLEDPTTALVLAQAMSLAGTSPVSPVPVEAFVQELHNMLVDGTPPPPAQPQAAPLPEPQNTVGPIRAKPKKKAKRSPTQGGALPSADVPRQAPTLEPDIDLAHGVEGPILQPVEA